MFSNKAGALASDLWRQMANLNKIDFPKDVEHLNHHSLSEQELSPMTDHQRALAKDWNVINKKMNWLIQEVVFIHNILVDHDTLLDTWKKFLWLITILAGSTGGLGGLIYIFMKIVHEIK